MVFLKRLQLETRFLKDKKLYLIKPEMQSNILSGQGKN